MKLFDGANLIQYFEIEDSNRRSDVMDRDVVRLLQQ